MEGDFSTFPLWLLSSGGSGTLQSSMECGTGVAAQEGKQQKKIRQKALFVQVCAHRMGPSHFSVSPPGSAVTQPTWQATLEGSWMSSRDFSESV